MKRLSALSIAPLLLFVLLQDGNAFSRPEDHVISKGNNFKQILNAPIDMIRMYALKNRQLNPIPFQIDKIDIDGKFFFNIKDEKEKAKERKEAYEDALDDNDTSKKMLTELKKKADWIEDMNVFDVQDELVLMAWDLGEKASINMFPEKAVKIEEIVITNPVDSDTAYAYAVLFKSNPPPLSPQKYITYDPIEDRVETTYYVADYAKDHPLIMEKSHLVDSEGNVQENFFDRLKLRIKLDLKWFFTLHFDEGNTNSEIIAVKCGPVRLIRRFVFWIDILSIPVTSSVALDYRYYPNGIVNPSVTNSTFDGKERLYEDSYSRILLDYNDTAHGFKFYTAKTKEPVTVDGKMSEAEKSLDLKNQNWFVLSNEGKGGVFCQLVLDKRAISHGVTGDIEYLDDKNEIIEPENVPGQHIVGFRINIQNFPKGKFKQYTYMYMDYRTKWERGKEKHYLNFIAKPLETRTVKIK